MIYTCPMHPQIEQDHAGNCPICGMTLEPEGTVASLAAAGELSRDGIETDAPSPEQRLEGHQHSG